MLSYKMDFSSCGIVPGFGKSSHIYGVKFNNDIIRVYVSCGGMSAACSPLGKH